MNPEGVHENFASDHEGVHSLCTQPTVVYTSINIRKIKFIAYIYIHFNQNTDEKSHISAKIETGKHLHTVFLLTAAQRQWRHDVADIHPIRL